MAFTACNKDEAESGYAIKVSNLDMSDYADIVKVKATDRYDNVIAETKFSNNGFTIYLPLTLDASTLMPVDECYQQNDMAGLANVSYINLRGCNNNGEFVCLFGIVDRAGAIGQYFMYSDKNFTYSGTGSYSTIYRLDVKAGWNSIYAGWIGSDYVVSNTVPAGVYWKPFQFD